MINLFEHSANSRTHSPSALAKALLANVADDYLNYYAASSSHTARAKRIDLRSFLQFLSELHGTKVDKLTLRQWTFSSVQRFVEQCLNKNESPSTVSRRLATLKHFGRTLSEKVPGFTNPAREVKAPRVQITKPKALTAAQIKRIRQSAQQRFDTHPSYIRSRNQMILELLLETGLRADEIRQLKYSQLDESLEWIRQVRTKGRRFRDVYIPTSARSSLRRYLNERAKELKRFFAELSVSQDKKLPVFLSTYKCNNKNIDSFLMSSKTLWRAVNQICKELKLHPHLLRHSFAVDFLESSKDIRLVSQALGHSDVRVTMRYTERRDEEIAQALERKNTGKSR